MTGCDRLTGCGRMAGYSRMDGYAMTVWLAMVVWLAGYGRMAGYGRIDGNGRVTGYVRVSDSGRTCGWLWPYGWLCYSHGGLTKLGRGICWRVGRRSLRKARCWTRQSPSEWLAAVPDRLVCHISPSLGCIK